MTHDMCASADSPKVDLKACDKTKDHNIKKKYCFHIW